MTSADIRTIEIAAAGLESADFERDRAVLDLESAVTGALARGTEIGAVAAAAEMTPGEIAGAADAEGDQAEGDRAEAAEPA